MYKNCLWIVYILEYDFPLRQNIYLTGLKCIPERTESPASLTGFFKKKIRQQFYLLFRPDEVPNPARSGVLSSDKSPWASESFKWLLLRLKISTEKQKLRNKSRSIYKIALFTLSHCGYFPVSDHCPLVQQFPGSCRLLVPRCSGTQRCCGQVRLGNPYYTPLLPQYH